MSFIFMITGPFVKQSYLDGDSRHTHQVVHHVFLDAVDQMLHPLLFFDPLHEPSPQLLVHFGVEVDEALCIFIVQKKLFLVNQTATLNDSSRDASR